MQSTEDITLHDDGEFISKNDVPLEASIPGAPLESILCTDELRNRPWRHPDYKKENRALVTLAGALTDSPRTILQTLAETILEVTQSDSSGVSLLTPDGKRFYWPAIAGLWKPHTGGGTPRDFGPCGDVLDRNMPLLMRHWEWRYTYFLPISPPVEEGLLVPFYVGGKAVGTIWVVMHDDGRKFDAEDERLLCSLGKFASSAYQTLASIDALKFQIAEREKAETAVRELTNGLETQVRVRTEELEQRNKEVQKLRDQIYKENIALRESEDRFRRMADRFEGILEIAEDAIISIDADQRIVLFNQGAEKTFGYTPAEIIGSPLDLLLPQRFGNVHRKHIQEFSQSADVARTMGHRREVSGRRKDGSEFPAEASISKLDLGGERVFTVILRDISERKRAEQRLVAQHTVTQVLAEAATLEEATPKILQAVCECLIWDLAELWRIDRAAGVLRCVEVWHKESIEATQFVATSHDRTFMPGIGLPGRVWSSREPAYIPDVVQDSNFPRAPIAAREGLHAAFAFPILLGSEVVGVMDFFSREIRQPDQDLLDMMATIGSQIGQFIERKRAEEELRRSEAYLAEAQRLSLTGSFGWNIFSGELFWSEETYRVVGLDRATKPTIEQVLQRIHPEDVAFVRQSLDRAAREGTGLDFEHRFVMPEGSIKHVHVVAHAIKDENGGLEYVGAMTEVTAAKIAFQQIQELKDQLQRENLVLREEVDAVSMFEEIVGASPTLQKVLSRVSKVAPTDSTVLITGETGTGKELIARAIHKRSPRSSRAFVSVNCAATPPSLIASELFGHEKGAFTGALQRRLGRFELAEGGTIFLDEIGELPMETQIALLHVLQEREFERVGGNLSLRADVRVIAATNRHLQAAIVAGTFRSDLFYRLNVFPIEIPPLRERKEDIILLIEYFINRYGRKAGKKIKSIDKNALALLQSYPWPGNIRELQNVIERSIILCDTENFSVDESWLSRESVSTPPASQVLAEELVSHEKERIEAALAETKGRVSGPSGAAAKLGIPASTLESKIKTLKINKYRFKSE